MADDIRNQGVDPILRLEAGTIPGFKRYKKFGRAPTLVNGQWGTIWDGNVDYPYADVNLVSPTLVSTNAGDTQTINIEGVDEDFQYVNMDVVLTGDTPVSLPEDIMLPFRMENMSADSLAGTVSLSVGATDYAIIRNGANEYNQTQMAIMVVPAGYYGLVTKVGFSYAGNNTGEVNYRSKSFGGAWKTKRPLDINEVYSEEVDFFFPEKTILDVRAKPSTANTSASAWFDLILVEKEVFHALWDDPGRVTLR